MPSRQVSPTPGVALIGYGAIAQMHMQALSKLGVTPLVVAGPNMEEAQSFAAQHGIRTVTTDVSAALAHPGVNATVLASPSEVHAAQSAEALAAGLHVLVEIPLALSHAEGAALVAQAATRGVVLMVCHTLRYWMPHRRAHAYLREGGQDVRHVVARGLSLRHENVGWSGRRRSWTDDVLWHHGGHAIDEVLRFLGKPVTSVAASVGPVWPVSGRSMDYAITLRTDDGAIATIALSYNARVGASDYTVISDQDTLVIDGADVTTSTGALVVGVDGEAEQEAAILAQDREFLEAIGSGEPPAAAAAHVVPVLAIQQQVADLAGGRSRT